VPADEHVVVDRSLIRPAEVEHLVGDASKAKRVLGWQPEVGFEELIRTMVDADLALLRGGSRAAFREPAVSLSPRPAR
jgi:GDPmannose 4,6-dehydratase